jgi:hypothetical protein
MANSKGKSSFGFSQRNKSNPIALATVITINVMLTEKKLSMMARKPVASIDLSGKIQRMQNTRITYEARKYPRKDRFVGDDLESN